jgi:hypothetical protein
LSTLQVVEDASLGRSLMLAQLAVLALCVARVGADLLHGPLGIEGRIALILADVFVALLVTKGVRWAIRSRRGHTAPRPPSSGLWPVGAHDGRGT